MVNALRMIIKAREMAAGRRPGCIARKNGAGLVALGRVMVIMAHLVDLGRVFSYIADAGRLVVAVPLGLVVKGRAFLGAVI